MNNHNIEKEVKLNKLKDRLFNEGIRVYRHEPNETPRANRQDLKAFIMKTLNISDAHTVNGWIDYLVTLGILEHNPTTQKTVNGHIKPSNDTRYFVHFEKCSHTHIDQFRKAIPSSNGLSDSSEKTSEQTAL